MYHISVTMVIKLYSVGRCDELRDPQNGRVLYSSHDIGEIASYECDHGYRLTGQPKRQCQDSGRWTDTAPTCERMLYNTASY